MCEGVTSRVLMPGAIEGPCMKPSQAVGHGEMKRKVTLVAFWNGFLPFQSWNPTAMLL